ncbi:hypothetical protein HOLleu_41237 [Holothuria leucospilota]|uniref:Uncharacterized protein n=1 Tax=Holothuria leucospilota TaxID=206669 RepID=A0A9Q0YG82_HOLLE|nr:hypothetical protein HOLleu_41237 [Holothuria leucospilota]
MRLEDGIYLTLLFSCTYLLTSNSYRYFFNDAITLTCIIMTQTDRYDYERAVL